MRTAWKASAVLRRDTRHTRAPESGRYPAVTKNTKRWCRGVVGREHQTEARYYRDVKLSGVGRSRLCQDWQILFCKVCGKELDHYYPFMVGQRLLDGKKPAWAK